jgi:hypothetical protein
VDGAELIGVTRVWSSFDVNDVHRVEITQIVRANIEVKAIIDPTFRVVVPSTGLTPYVESTADSVWQALRDCAEQLKRRAESEQSGSTSDTVDVPDRGPEEVSNGQDQEEPAP